VKIPRHTARIASHGISQKSVSDFTGRMLLRPKCVSSPIPQSHAQRIAQLSVHRSLTGAKPSATPPRVARMIHIPMDLTASIGNQSQFVLASTTQMLPELIHASNRAKAPAVRKHIQWAALTSQSLLRLQYQPRPRLLRQLSPREPLPPLL
jgi:hypothetical protein